MRPRLDWLPDLNLDRPRLMLFVVHVPIIAQAPLYSIFGALGVAPSGYPWLAGLAGAAILGIQLRHSLAMARGKRPRGGRWTWLALVVLAYAPLHWLGLNWVTAQYPVMASAPMIFDGWLAAAAIAGPCAYIGYQFASVFPVHHGPASYADYLYWVAYYVGSVPIVPTALYASARLVRVTLELRGNQIALARTAVGRERLRVSRDLHDLLGHSLSAISLKGDLAIRLLRRDSTAAVAEINGLTEVAIEALAGLRAIAAGSPEITLAGELSSARALLAAAGVAVRVRGDISAIPPTAAETLAWAVREGTTNILRHATAATAVITVRQVDGFARLEIVNDGAQPTEGAQPTTGNGGHGLSGLSGRIQEVSGNLSHGRLNNERFQLTAQVPVTAAAAAEEPHWTVSGSSSPKTST